MDKCNDNAVKTCLLKLFEKIFEKHLTRERVYNGNVERFFGIRCKKVLTVRKANGVKVAKKNVFLL